MRGNARRRTVGRLSARSIAFVAGGAGLVGEAIVRALCDSSAVERVIFSSRDSRKLADVRERLRPERATRAVPVEGDAGDAADAVRLAGETLREFGRIDVAIASLGGGEADGRALLELDGSAYERAMHEMLGTHVAFARAFVPRLTAGGLYLGIGGGAAFAPMRGGGVISIAAAGQAMLTRVLAAELRGATRAVELIVNAPIPARGEPAARGAIAASSVAEAVEEIVRTGGAGSAGVTVDGPILVMNPPPN